jgi:prolipoprotein diacylglyceryltransferase
MRPALAAWLDARGLPAWLLPDYAILAGLASVLGVLLAVRLARRDGAPVAIEARAMAVAYLGALAGGYLIEILRLLPAAVSARSIEPLFEAGRAAYGGLLFGALAAALYLRLRGVPIAPFFDRVAISTGVVFAFVRTGCFLEGCDYGRVTAGPLGVRFPAFSDAALDHEARGWIATGTESLPVHATQLYEAGVGLLGAAAAYIVLRRRPARDGAAFLAFLAVYATGRFFVEMFRGDPSRGIYAGVSSAQWISIVVFAGVCGALVRARAQRDAFALRCEK